VVPVLFDAARPAGALALPFRLLAARLRNGPGRLLPPGGSSALAALGHLNAMLELAAQVERGDAPRPRAIWVALGTGGTAAGLSAGLGLLGWDAPLCAVAVAAWPFDRAARARAMAGAALRLLGEGPRREAAPLQVTRRFRGRGYGVPTPEAEEARALAAGDGLALEPTYTGKALAALVAAARARESPGPLLFWHTAPAP
jgi:D-cysteine desulfhydrase